MLERLEIERFDRKTNNMKLNVKGHKQLRLMRGFDREPFDNKDN